MCNESNGFLSVFHYLQNDGVTLNLWREFFPSTHPRWWSASQIFRRGKDTIKGWPYLFIWRSFASTALNRSIKIINGNKEDENKYRAGKEY